MADAPRITNFTNFSRDGDRRILAGSKDASEIFIVSSHVMALTGKEWATMFGPDSSFFTTESSNRPSGIIQIPMPDDDPAALRVLLSVAHLKHSMIPKTLSFEELVQIAILSDKYDLAELISPWIGGWVKHVQENYKENSNDRGWLFVAWTFGIASIFERVSNVCIRNSSITDFSKRAREGPNERADQLPLGGGLEDRTVGEELRPDARLEDGNDIGTHIMPPGVEGM